VGLDRVERVMGWPSCASAPPPPCRAVGELTAPLFPGGGELPEARGDLADLLALAGATVDRAWRIGADIAQARNAHFTNTRAELAAALRGAYDWFEGDVTVEPDGTPVMRHDPRGRFDLDLRSWLAVLRVSGRGAKVDLKASAALPRVLALVRASGIPQERLIINVEALPLAQLRLIRRALPDVIVNINPPRDGTAELEPADIVRLQLAALAVGGRVMFPIRIDLLTRGIVDALRPFGRIATWNWPGLTDSDAGDALRVRALGVDGMVDLRSSHGILQTLSATIAEAVASLVGWHAVHRLLDPFD
jgi:hypothetical protein